MRSSQIMRLAAGVALAGLLSAVAVRSQVVAPTVYRMQSSSDYHLANCRLAKSFPISPISLATALETKLTPCLLCRPHETAEARNYLAVATEAERTRPFAKLTRQQAADIAVAAAKDVESPDPRITAALGADKPMLFRRLFMLQAQKISEDYDGNPLDIYSNDAISVRAMGPAVAYSIDAAERIRKMDPLAGTLWADGVLVMASALTINAPSFEKIVLTRDGVVVPPIANLLSPVEKVTGMGAKVIVHEGGVLFPPSAFFPTAQVVTLTLIPVAGDNIVRLLSNKELRSLQ